MFKLLLPWEQTLSPPVTEEKKKKKKKKYINVISQKGISAYADQVDVQMCVRHDIYHHLMLRFSAISHLTRQHKNAAERRY